jgi:hypothetical protein
MPPSKNNTLEELEQEGKTRRKTKQSHKIAGQKKADKASADFWRKKDHFAVQTHITGWGDLQYAFKFILFFNVIVGFNLWAFYAFMPEDSAFSTSATPMLFSLMALVVFAGAFLYSQHRISQKMLEEKQWIDQHEFELISYPDIFVYRAYSVLDFTLEFQFENNQPDVDYLLNLFSTLPLEVTFEGGKTDPYHFKLTNKKASKFNRHRRWAYQWIHLAVDNHLSALHTKYPLKQIVFESGKQELPEDWYVALKKPIWKLN